MSAETNSEEEKNMSPKIILTFHNIRFKSLCLQKNDITLSTPDVKLKTQT